MSNYRVLIGLVLAILLANQFAALGGVKEDPYYELTETDDLYLWWSISTNKVLPKQKNLNMKQRIIEISAARNEYESFQLIISAKRDSKIERITVSNFTSGRKQFPSQDNVEIYKVGYVPVTNPTDKLGQTGYWPDPLIPLALSKENPLPLNPKENNIFWFTIYVPEQAVSGNYKAYIRIKLSQSTVITEVPMQLRVFNFTLPKETHTRTAYGVNINNDWHQLKEKDDFRKVYDLYLQVLYKHRICPYNPMAYSPIEIKLMPIKEGETILDYTVELDFTEFDKAAEYYLDKLGFNAFNFPLKLTYEGMKAFNEDYKRLAKKIFSAQVLHLKEKDWLGKAYCYWIDEPELNNIPFSYVESGMEFLKENTSDLKRLLTLCKAPAPDSRYYNLVNLWVPLLSFLDREAAQERQNRGEEVWWYVCTVPKSPYPNNFIDHPALNHRIRYWMMEKYQIQGDLYWTTTFWAHRNPYEDAASYTDSTKKNSYGNGDGLLLYPPSKVPPEKPLIAPPNPSMRLEIIRDGLEDREYFWLLKQELNRLKLPANYEKAKDLLKEAEWMLLEPNSLIKTLKDFETDPLRIQQSRQKIAQIIERLRQN